MENTLRFFLRQIHLDPMQISQSLIYKYSRRRPEVQCISERVDVFLRCHHRILMLVIHYRPISRNRLIPISAAYTAPSLISELP